MSSGQCHMSRLAKEKLGASHGTVTNGIGAHSAAGVELWLRLELRTGRIGPEDQYSSTMLRNPSRTRESSLKPKKALGRPVELDEAQTSLSNIVLVENSK